MVLKEYHKAIETFENGLKLEPNNAELTEGLQKVSMMISAQQRSSEADPEQIKRAMADPEIQAILTDPAMNQIIKDISENPGAARTYVVASYALPLSPLPPSFLLLFFSNHPFFL